MNWVIATPGRTGSNLIAHHLVDMGYEKCERDTKGDNSSIIEKSKNFSVVVHDHGILSLKPHGDSSLCVSLRKDVFQQTCSGLIAVKTNEFSAKQYNTRPLKFSVDYEKFDSMISILMTTGLFQASQVGNEKWKNSFVVFYEDLIDMGIVEFCKKHDMPYKESSIWQDKKTPRRPEDTIENYDELLKYYNDKYTAKVEKYLLDVTK